MTQTTIGARKAAVELLRLTVRGELLWNSHSIDRISEVIQEEMDREVCKHLKPTPRSLNIHGIANE